MFEYLGITIAQFETALLIFVRIFTLLSVLPIFSLEDVDVRVRIWFGFFLTLICYGIVPIPKELPVAFYAMIPLAVKEVLVALCIGMFSSFLFESIQFAGAQVGQLMGLDMITMFDPTTEEEHNVIGQLGVFFAILLLFATGGYHFFIKAIFNSFYLIPLTHFHFGGDLLTKAIYITGQIFVLGIKIGAPLIIVLYLTRILVGFLEKMAQEADVFSIIITLELMLGFYLLVYYWPYFSYIFFKVFNIYQSDILTVIKMLGK